MAFLVAGGHRLEYAWTGPRPGEAPTLVFLHEGLGCVGMWGDFPARLAAATGCGVLNYSRWGHGASAPIATPRAVSYMHDEALVTLPEVLDAAAVERAIFIGHSDGGSIALINAGSEKACASALILEAAHVFVEPLTVASIAAAGETFRTTDLPARLGRHHGDNTEGMFKAWNDIWLHPDFRHWNIEEYLPRVDCPILAIQGRDDEYGTERQIRAIEAQTRGRVETHLLDACRHAPHRDQTDTVLRLMTNFIGVIVAHGKRT